MFESDQIEAYRSIKAPDSLRERVLQEAEMHSSKPRIVPILCTAALTAAALLLVVGLQSPDKTQSIRMNGITLTEEGTPVTESNPGIAPANARSADTIRVPLTIALPAEVTVSDGTLCFPEESREVQSGVSVELEENAQLEWCISAAQRSDSYSILLVDGTGSSELTLVYDSAAAIWMISCETE